MEIDFRHRQSAHCESGVAAALLMHSGLEISEAMAFGLGRGLFFAYLPFIRIHNMPLVTYRAAAGNILKKIKRIPGVDIRWQVFRGQDRDRAMDELDATLARGIPVGLQTGVFWLPYFPRELRFHFNAHNLVVYGREENTYLISDPVFPGPVRCPAEDLARARFASGALAPKGKMYYLAAAPAELDVNTLVAPAIHDISRAMLASPFPLIGIRGIRFLAARLEQWPRRLGDERALLHVAHVIRMQEEIGTGGGGFRFMFAAFLQESSTLLNDDLLQDCAARIIRSGDCWREFAVIGARLCKDRSRPGEGFPAMAEKIKSCAQLEEAVFSDLEAWAKGR